MIIFRKKEGFTFLCRGVDGKRRTALRYMLCMIQRWVSAKTGSFRAKDTTPCLSSFRAVEEMLQVLSAVRRRLGWRKERSARVADEGTLASAGEAGAQPGPVWGCGLVALVAVASCLMCQAEEEEEPGWTSARRPRDDEMNHLMLRDSMRYRIYA